MTTEQKEAIEYLEESVLIYKNTLPKISEAIETVLNLIQEQEIEIEASRQITTEINNDVKKLITECKNKNRIIDLMAKAFKQDDVRSIEEIKQYFERKVEDESND